ncbi:MAG: hypothetical protein HYZ74_04180 [Elusimicrobia bacterium]|nr:hypothetical protein [Elusimicrobiota bacterium]
MRASAFAVLLAVAAAAATPAPYGVLLLAHGGDPSWNAEIAALRARTDARVPTETALGMADTTAMQDAVDRLKARGVGRIVAVPLFVSSRSEVLDQTRYALGLSKKPSEVLRAAFARMGAAHAPTRPGGGGSAAHAHHGHAHAFSTERVRLPLPLVMSPALDDHPLVASILLERARALSRDANKESVVLVAHGPVDDAALPAWTDTLAALCARVRSEGAFREVSYGVLRDDAVSSSPPPRESTTTTATPPTAGSTSTNTSCRAFMEPSLWRTRTSPRCGRRLCSWPRWATTRKVMSPPSS